MPTIYNTNKRKGLFFIPSGAIKSESAAFSYSQESYRVDESNPTPTITGDTGGTFTATPEGLTLNSSTGEITLSSSVINSYVVTYTLPSGTFENRSLGIEAAAFASTQSFSFDGVNDYILATTTPSKLGFPSTTVSNGGFSISFWYYPNSIQNFDVILQSTNTNAFNGFGVWQSTTNNGLNFWVGNYSQGDLYTTNNSFTDTKWYHISCTFQGGATHTSNIYIDGVLNNTVSYTTSRNIHSGENILIGGWPFYSRYFTGKLDELAIWNSALSSTAVTEIYNSGVPNDLDTLSNASSPTAWYRMGE